VTTDARRSAAAATRNREPILAVLRGRLAPDARVLEIGSGTGEHAVHFCAALPALDWQPSDPDAANRASIAAWIAHAGLRNVHAPIDLDVRLPTWHGAEARAPYDSVVSINMIHIAPWACALALLDGAARVLRDGGLLFLYGPFMRGGAHTAPSNAAFDARLRADDPEWGVRDLDDVIREAALRGLALTAIVEMPANNLSVFFEARRRE
jgi:cyclopropane fatty-acyl-phospholipid synthase-like methyltransferase